MQNTHSIQDIGLADKVTSSVHPNLRIMSTIAPAAAITFALFIAMGGLINTDFAPVEKSESRTIEPFTAQEQSDEIRTESRIKPKRLKVADQPPPLPKYSSNKTDVNLPTPNLEVTVPTKISFTKVEFPTPRRSIWDDSDAKPIRPPVVVYPTRAASQGIEGSCQVKFNVDVAGRPYGVEADCTHSVFRNEATRAVKKVEFVPALENGQPRERRNVVYPLQFKLN